MNIPQALPSENSDAGTFARQLAQIIGPAYQPADGTAIAAELLALGEAINDVLQSVLTALDEAFADRAVNLLSELEVEYRLSVRPDLPNATRQNRLVAKIRALRGGTPQQIILTVQKLVGTSPTVQLYEYPTANANLALEPRGVFQFGVVIGLTAWNDYEKRVQAQAIVDQMKPAHTRGDIGSSSGFILGTSLLGRELLAP